MEGEQYITFNPDTFADQALWTYRDLQKLSKKIGLNAKLKREELEENLRLWHRSRIDGQTLVPIASRDDEETIEMNVVGNNFSLLAINVVGSNNSGNNHTINTDFDKSSSKRRTSLTLLNTERNDKLYEQTVLLSPTLLRPLAEDVTTPGKSILKVSSKVNIPKSEVRSDRKDTVRNTTFNTEIVPMDEDDVKSPENRTKSSGKKLSKVVHGNLKSICFSPVNGIKIISHRSDLSDNEDGEEGEEGEEEDEDEYDYMDSMVSS